MRKLSFDTGVVKKTRVMNLPPRFGRWPLIVDKIVLKLSTRCSVGMSNCIGISYRKEKINAWRLVNWDVSFYRHFLTRPIDVSTRPKLSWFSSRLPEMKIPLMNFDTKAGTSKPNVSFFGDGNFFFSKPRSANNSGIISGWARMNW